jgi:hypothetical protein
MITSEKGHYKSPTITLLVASVLSIATWRVSSFECGTSRVSDLRLRLARVLDATEPTIRITVKMIKFGYLNSPRQRIANQNSEQPTKHRTNPVDPPTIPYTGDY